jgi:hypothetical protein
MLADLRPGEKVNPYEMIQRMTSSYAFPVQQNVEFLSLPNLEAIQKQSGVLAEKRPDIVDALAVLIGGQFTVTKDGAYFFPTPRGLKLRLGESSSAVRSLLDVTYYVQHVLRPGDCFIIDEPELNLHPKNQRRFARLLGRLVNAGVKVFLTTHSDYIIRELNTLILLAGRHRTRARLLQELGYDERELINAASVRFYRTRHQTEDEAISAETTVLEQVPVAAATGIEVESFDIETNELNRIQDSIVYTPELEESELASNE